MRAIFWLFMSFIALACLVACGPQSGALADVRYESDGHTIALLPLPLAAWQYCENKSVLFQEGAWEWSSREPQLAIVDWDTGSASEVNLPDPSPTTSYTFSQSPDCISLALSRSGELYIINLTSGQTRKWTIGSHPAYSPDGSRIAFWRKDKLVLKSIANDVEQTIDTVSRTWGPEYGWEEEIIWSPTGEAIAFVMFGGERYQNWPELAILTLSDRSVTVIDSVIRTTDTPNSGYLTKPNWSPDDRLIVYTSMASYDSDTATLYIRDSTSGCVVKSFPVDKKFGKVFWAPDGSRLVLASGSGEAEVIPINDVLGVDDYKSFQAQCEEQR